ncbi:MAG: site-specific DNA-methyltransferase [Candidatus Lokiarchaeota archaeon]|nr:site-specific DNA-methyltransferase [Candidatus Lokiarchaeota archaeon]
MVRRLNSMKVMDQVITDQYALYHGDCVDVISELPDDSIHFSIYSPPFCGMYHYSSSERDMSNCTSYREFFEHYEFLVDLISRVTMPGRITAVHCMDIPRGTDKGLRDFPGDIIRLHEKFGLRYIARYHVWKEPLGVRNRTMAKGLAHRQLIDDSTLCDVASADYLLMFRKRGKNPIPVKHPKGLMRYAGERKVPSDLWKYRGHKGKQRDNKFSQWIWRQYASAFWDDVRIDRVLPYKKARDVDDEKHVHPLQLDVIERAVILRSNPGETVLTPFMGVGSEVYGSVLNGRKAIGVELKKSYFKQAVRNCKSIEESDEAMNFNWGDHIDE